MFYKLKFNMKYLKFKIFCRNLTNDEWSDHVRMWGFINLLWMRGVTVIPALGRNILKRWWIVKWKATEELWFVKVWILSTVFPSFHCQVRTDNVRSVMYTRQNTRDTLQTCIVVATSLSIKPISGCVRTACSQLFDKSGTSC